VFLAGNFGLFDGNVLRALTSTVYCGDLRDCGLRNYAGTVTLTADLDVPAAAGGLVLRLDTGERIAEVLAAGNSLGVRAWAPFEWEIPVELHGTATTFEIILTPSIGAMFEKSHDHAKAPEVRRTYWPGQHAALGTLRPPAWVLR